VQIAQHVEGPVQMIWTREDEPGRRASSAVLRSV
jgi:hypothetical protein